MRNAERERVGGVFCRKGEPDAFVIASNRTNYLLNPLTHFLHFPTLVNVERSKEKHKQRNKNKEIRQEKKLLNAGCASCVDMGPSHCFPFRVCCPASNAWGSVQWAPQ